MKIFFNALLIFLASSLQAQTDDYSILYQNKEAARYVNPVIGTAGEGYTYPGATTPWGMVSASPHTTYTSLLGYFFRKKIAPAGYYYGEPRIDGFGQTHLSGVACNELGAPLIAVNAGNMTPGDYASTYSNEIAKAGYYAVNLDDMQTRVQMTTTRHTACYRFTFMGPGIHFVMLDAFKNLSWGDHNGFVEKSDHQTFRGWSQTGNFCGQGNEQKVYFCLKTITLPEESGLWRSERKLSGTKQASGKVGAWMSYEKTRVADVAIGISYVSMENAKENLESEIGDKDFETVLRENISRWESVLGRIKIKDENRDRDKELFYTALYHALLHPNVVSDVNGEYPLYESEGHGINKEHPRYGLFSMWDTYRNVHALLSLLYPERQQDMLYTLEDMTLEAGHPPRWELYGSEINLMVGDPALSIISEGFVKGFKFKHPEKLFEVLYQNATDIHGAWRPGNAAYWEYGFIPRKTEDVWGSVSTTLEYCYHDWALSRFARMTGHEKEASLLAGQSKCWRTLLDDETKLLRPKNKEGEWMSRFDPAAMTDYSLWLSYILKNHGGPGFVEGNAYQYTFMVPHDPEGLIEFFGSVEAFGDNLQNVFDQGYFTLWNEPDMIYPYLLGKDPKHIFNMQQELQRQRAENFTSRADGLPGNDDAGTLSAWFVFTALGFYPVNPAGGAYALGIPLFNHIEMDIPEADSLFCITADFDVQTEHWENITYNSEELDGLFIKHEQILHGGELRFNKNVIQNSRRIHHGSF